MGSFRRNGAFRKQGTGPLEVKTMISKIKNVTWCAPHSLQSPESANLRRVCGSPVWAIKNNRSLAEQLGTILKGPMPRLQSITWREHMTQKKNSSENVWIVPKSVNGLEKDKSFTTSWLVGLFCTRSLELLHEVMTSQCEAGPSFSGKVAETSLCWWISHTWC